MENKKASRFRFFKQFNSMDCGPTCLRMISHFYGKHYSMETIRQLTGFNLVGSSLLGLSEAAERLGFRTRAVKITYDQLTQVTFPAVLHWNQDHFVVIRGINKRMGKSFVTIADPARGIIRLAKTDFTHHWISARNSRGNDVGIVLLLEPTPHFYLKEGEEDRNLSWGIVTQYLGKNKWYLFQVFLAMVIASFFQLLFPYLVQSLVDTGINTQDLQYITIVLIAQIILVFSRSIIDFIRSRLLLGISIMINMSILSDFWIKLTKLPLDYFDNHKAGDTLQRLSDNKQIQSFLTGSAVNTIFSILSLIIFSIVLCIYNQILFIIFLLGSILYLSWIRIFLRVRRKINYQTFHLNTKENSASIELVQGMQEIRLKGAEQVKRWEWENIQAGIFKLNIKGLKYSQVQQAGAILINQGKDLFITFFVARLVIQGNLTFGSMLAIQYIIGQLSGPIEQLVGFIQVGQDAKISMERLNEIHSLKEEESSNRNYIRYLPECKSIEITKLTFSYPGVANEPVFNGLSLIIPEGKVTAIVGVSGSGKTTLIKLLLKFYENYTGDIRIGDSNFAYLSPSFWRKQCGAVLQDGYIFNDTIATNISIGNETFSYERLVECSKAANILSFIESLPNGFSTKLGYEGVGISQGQKQRILIARALYNNPLYLFLDEATNALDANNEKTIIENLQSIFKGRTVVVIAHRLSTVKNADKIIVLNKGEITEEGTHAQLIENQGLYFELVKNQLELNQ